jgi:phytoene dehydrogenase-like protein
MTTLTVIGGGLAGMIAAITAAEHGAGVELHEAHEQLGGRARSTPGPFVANWGPHALYADGPLWAWLAERDLLPARHRAAMTGLRFRHRGETRRMPPAAMLRSFAVARPKAAVPADRSFRDWVRLRYGSETAALWSNAAGVFTFTNDPGALSAAFVAERLPRATAFPPAARFVTGGWSSLVDGLAHRLAELGVRVVTRSPVDGLPDSPVVVALDQAAARRLLGDESVWWHGARTVLLDVGIVAARGDAYIVSDLDEAGWAERFSRVDRTLAPKGHSLVQAHLGLLPDESLDAGVARAEALLDAGFADWRQREVWRRRAVVDCQSGALDPPGRTWRDRPAIERGDGVFLCGDYVAAPGLLAEVSWASAVAAGRSAATLVTRSPARMAPGSTT